MARLSSGCIPYRYDKDVRIQVLLVRSTGGSRWILPKGGIEPGLSRRENAIKEAAEEAGVVGELGSKVGNYTYDKDGIEQDVTMYAMHVVLELEAYPESLTRKRCWASVTEALTLLTPELLWLLDFAKELESNPKP